MILFTILVLIALILLAVVILSISILGAGTIVIFGDVIVCIFLIGLIIYKLFFNKG